MKNFHFNALAACAILMAIFSATPLHAQDEEAIINRMKQRVSAIDALKTSGLVGENNKGFLEQRGALNPDQTKHMTLENADRKDLYSILAGRLGLTISVVGQGRAEDLRNKSAPGVWLQGTDNKWYKK